MKIKVTQKTEIEIPSPFYCKYGDYCWFKVYSERCCIRVHLSKNNADIGILPAEVPFQLAASPTECTEEEFTNKFNEAVNKISEYGQVRRTIPATAGERI